MWDIPRTIVVVVVLAVVDHRPRWRLRGSASIKTAYFSFIGDSLKYVLIEMVTPKSFRRHSFYAIVFCWERENSVQRWEGRRASVWEKQNKNALHVRGSVNCGTPEKCLVMARLNFPALSSDGKIQHVCSNVYVHMAYFIITNASGKWFIWRQY